MKNTLLLFFASILIFSCNKEDLIGSTNGVYYESTGNLLILQIGDTLECAYEFNLSSINLENDSLPLYFEREENELVPKTYWKFSPNPDTLFWYSTEDQWFANPLIRKDDLELNSYELSYNPDLIQLITSTNSDHSTLWSQIANLKIVQDYRMANPSSKIALKRVVFREFNKEYSLNVPVEKHLFFVVK